MCSLCVCVFCVYYDVKFVCVCVCVYSMGYHGGGGSGQRRVQVREMGASCIQWVPARWLVR